MPPTPNQRSPQDDTAEYAVLRLPSYDEGCHRLVRVDHADVDELARTFWKLRLSGTRIRAHRLVRTPDGRRKSLELNRQILGDPPFEGACVLHLNNDRLDYTRANLAWGTLAEALAHRRPIAGGLCPYKGVTFNWRNAKFVATFDGRKRGRFEDARDAACAVDDLAFARFGHLAWLNFPQRYEGLKPGDPPRPIPLEELYDRDDLYND